MKLLQVCNVGNICGGTAACAWTIARALPGWQHAVHFLSPMTVETRRAFSGWSVAEVRRFGRDSERRERPDVILLHNIAQGESLGDSRCPVVQYHHSVGPRLAADIHVACSRWLAERIPGRVPVLYQPVPAPIAIEEDRRGLDDEPIIGRICTATSRKWPPETVAWYGELAQRFPRVRWEFVGPPEAMRTALSAACEGRAAFHPAGWGARRHLRRWHAMLYHHPTLDESFGRTVAEAMRAGCVPITDDRGGFREQIVPGETGFLCGNLDEFTAAVAAIGTPAVRWRLARQARVRADELFSLRTFAGSFYALLSASAPS